MIYTSILQLIFILFVLCLHIQSHSTLSDENIETELTYIDMYENSDQCNFVLVSPKRVINPYKSDLTNLVPQKPFGSFYLKCAACLAVADQIIKLTENIIASSETSQINQNVSNKISELCSQGFKNYDLRKYNEYSLVTDKLKCTEHVKSNMDGGWTKKLRELCNLYTTHLDLQHISNIYSNNTQEIKTHLCNGTGIFRDCQKLQIEAPSNLEELCEMCDC